MWKRYLAIAAIGLALLTSGCGKKDKGDGVASVTGDKPSASSSVKPNSADNDEQAEKFQQCMKDHGVEVHMAGPGDNDDGGPVEIQGSPGADDGPQVSKEQMDKAQAACRQYMPNGGVPPTLDPEEQEALRKFAQCMRDNGLKDFPDPASEGGLEIAATPGSDLDPHSDKFKAAEAKCRSLMPSPKAREAGGQ
jgi:hypothetical protein